VGNGKMVHNFTVEIAGKYGIEEAILLENIVFLCLKNRANNRHYHDGEYWTYNSAQGFNRYYPYIHPKKIERALKRLEEAKLIKSGNYNKSGYDRTKWYAATEEAYRLTNCLDALDKMSNGRGDTPNGEDNVTDPLDDLSNGEDSMSNGIGQNVEPIPDNKPDSNTDSNTDNTPLTPLGESADDFDAEKIKSAKSGVIEIDGDAAFDELCAIYPRDNGNEKAKSAYMGYLTNGRKFDGYPVAKFNHWQIYAAIKKFAAEMEQEDRERDKMPYFSTLFNADMLGYVRKSQAGYKRAMLNKYGEGWEKIKFRYTFAHPKKERKRRRES
jgi:hypothetical protein